jgi:hypothetical protein
MNLDTLKGALKSNTVHCSLILMAVGIAEQLLPGFVSAYVSPKYVGAVMAAVGVLFLVLRMRTTQSLASKA